MLSFASVGMFPIPAIPDILSILCNELQKCVAPSISTQRSASYDFPGHRSCDAPDLSTLPGCDNSPDDSSRPSCARQLFWRESEAQHPVLRYCSLRRSCRFVFRSRVSYFRAIGVCPSLSAGNAPIALRDVAAPSRDAHKLTLILISHRGPRASEPATRTLPGTTRSTTYSRLVVCGRVRSQHCCVADVRGRTALEGVFVPGCRYVQHQGFAQESSQDGVHHDW